MNNLTTPTNHRYDILNAQLDALCNEWVTFQTIRTPDGRVLLVQKNDGCTRTIPSGGPR